MCVKYKLSIYVLIYVLSIYVLIVLREQLFQFRDVSVIVCVSFIFSCPD